MSSLEWALIQSDRCGHKKDNQGHMKRKTLEGHSEKPVIRQLKWGASQEPNLDIGLLAFRMMRKLIYVI